MKKRIWDLYAPIYEKAMRADKKLCQFIVSRYISPDSFSDMIPSPFRFYIHYIIIQKMQS